MSESDHLVNRKGQMGGVSSRENGLYDDPHQ